MTIAVTQFVAAAAKALPGTSVPPGAEGLPADEGFADILLGKVPPLLQAAAPLIDDSRREPTLEAPADAAQLFAALGLPYPVATGGLPVDDGVAIEKASEGTTLSLPVSTESVDPASDADRIARLPGGAVAADPSARQEPALFGSAEQFVAAKLAGTDVPQGTPSAGLEMNVSSSGTLPTQLAGVANASPGQTPAATSTAMQLATPVRDAAWPAEFAQKVTWMARQDLQSAQITLNPPQLGPIEISLDVRNDQASAVFVSASAEVREAIESAVPRLREMLAGVGVELGQTNVSHQSFRNGNGDTRPGSGNAARDGVSENSGGSRELAAAGFVRPGSSGRGLVDTFA